MTRERSISSAALYSHQYRDLMLFPIAGHGEFCPRGVALKILPFKSGWSHADNPKTIFEIKETIGKP
jgi:hypothetical protein